MTRLARLWDAFITDREPQRALFCTYGFDASFFESEVIPAMFPTTLGLDSESGSSSGYLNAADNALVRRQVSVFYNHLLGDGPELVYGTWRIDVAPRAFHAKLIALDYGDVIRVVIGSANLTRAAWTRLLELFVVEDLVPGEPHAWSDGLRHFVSRLAALIPNDHVDARNELAGNLPAVRAASGSSRVTSTWEEPLLDALLSGLRRVTAVDAVTPFFEGSDGPGVFDDLERRLGAVKGRLFTSATAADGRSLVSGPPEKLRTLVTTGGWQLHAVDEAWEGDEDGAPLRALHGKLLGITHSNGVRLMVGSANITRAALLHQAPAANVELVVLDDCAAKDLKSALPQATLLAPGDVDFEDIGSPSDEDDEAPIGAERFVLEASYTAAARRLSLTLVADAPELTIRYGDRVLAGDSLGNVWVAALELAAPRYVIVDDGHALGVVPFVILDPQAFVPRGNAAEIGLEAFFDILAGGREPAAFADGDARAAWGPGSGVSRDAALVGTRGAIPWRRYLAAVAGLGRELEQERHVPRSLRFTIENPTRLAGLIARLHDAHDGRRFTTADLVYALYELGRELSRVSALDAPAPSRALLRSEADRIKRGRDELARAAGSRLLAQLRVLTKMDAA